MPSMAADSQTGAGSGGGTGQAESTRPSPRALMNEWEELCARYLPVADSDSFWMFSRPVAPVDPPQGWKLHVSATVLTACEILRKVAPYLTNRGVLFKAPRSLAEVSKLNCGLHYGYSQIGKCITVYPRSTEQALLIARRLDQLSYGVSAPSVPFDVRYRPGGAVFYRYGAFDSLTVEQPGGARVPAVRAPDGGLVPDRRAPGAAVPDWVTDPFPKGGAPREAKMGSPLGTSIFAYKALSQRGKGGVYKVLDTSTGSARLCVLKEGRRHGETAWDGRDGYWWVRHEERVLDALSRSGVGVPDVYTSFRSRSSYYVAMELVGGTNLQQIISEAPAPLPPGRALRYGAQLAELLDRIHRAGWVWRDCKPSNLMISEGGDMRPLDFEGAHPLGEPDPEPWGTLGYVPPEWPAGPRPGAGAAQDLYALGAVLYQLFRGQVPNNELSAGPQRDLPPAIDSLISSLLDPSSKARPNARVAAEILRGAFDAPPGGPPLTF